MAFKVSIATGAWSTATTWGSVSNTPSYHATATTLITGGARYTAAFTSPGATVNCLGAMIHITSPAVSAGNNLVLTLQSNPASWADVALATVSVPLASLPTKYSYRVFLRIPATTSTDVTAGYYRFKIMTDATTTSSGLACSDSGGTLYSFIAVDDQTGVPASTDDVFIAGSNGATAVAVTVDGTQAIGGSLSTAVPVVRSFLSAITLMADGELKWDTAANSQLTVDGNIEGYPDGKITMDGSADITKTQKLIWAESVTTAHGAYIYDGCTTKIKGASRAYWRTHYVSGTGMVGGKFGGGVNLDGIASAYSSVDHADFQPAGNFSVMAVFRSILATGYGTLFQSYSNASSKFAGISLQFNGNGRLNFISGNNTGTTGGTHYQQVYPTTVYSDGALHKVICTYDGAKLHLYVDGTEFGTGVVWTNAAAFAATNYPRVGCANDSGTNKNFHNGLLDEVAFFPSDALSQAEVTTLQTNELNTQAAILAKAVAYYRFESGALTTDTKGVHPLTAISVPTESSNLVLAEAVDWTVGDEIVIGASSDNATNYQECEAGIIRTKISATTYVVDGMNNTGVIELLVNPGFETLGAGGADVWGTWFEGAGGGTIANTTTGAEVHSGVNACKLTYVSGASPYVYNAMTVTPSTLYNYTFWTRGDGTNCGKYAVYDATNGAWIIPAIDTLVTGTTYVQISVSFTTPATCTGARVYFYSQTAGSAYFDDASVIKEGINYTHNSNAWVVNLTKNVTITSTATNMGWYWLNYNTVVGGAEFTHSRHENLGGTLTNQTGLIIVNGVSCKCIFDNNVQYRGLGSYPWHINSRIAETFTNNVLYGAGGSPAYALYDVAPNHILNDWMMFKIYRAATLFSGCYNSTVNRMIIISSNATSATVGYGGYQFTGNGKGMVFNDCEVHCSRWGVQNTAPSYVILNNLLCGTKGKNSVADVSITSGYSADLTFINSTFTATTLMDFYMLSMDGTEIRFHQLNTTLNNHRWYTNYGQARSTGAGLADTNVRTPGSLGICLMSEDATDGFLWNFNIFAKASSIVNFFGYFQLNSTFTGDAASSARVEIWLAGSSTADATTTLSKLTNAWQAVSMSVNNTSTVDGLAEIRVYAVSATAGAYLYCDDFFNAGDTVSSSDKVTGLDTWTNGKPVSIIAPQATSPADIWTFNTTQLTTANTTGKKLMSLKNASLLVDGEIII